MKQAALTLVLLAFTAGHVLSDPPPNVSSSLSGNYLEVRTCDVYTGPCFANAEMGLTGKEGLLVWAIEQGSWNGVPLKGLNAIAVVRTDQTLGNVNYQPREGRGVIILDSKATPAQKKALTEMIKAEAGELVSEVVAVRSETIEADFATCSKSGCARIQAGELVDIATRCLGEKDHLCGNEDTFYPPLTKIEGALPAFTQWASFQGKELDVTWQAAGQRSAFLGTFEMTGAPLTAARSQ